MENFATCYVLLYSLDGLSPSHIYIYENEDKILHFVQAIIINQGSNLAPKASAGVSLLTCCTTSKSSVSSIKVEYQFSTCCCLDSLRRPLV